jgi:hypothetical protein
VRLENWKHALNKQRGDVKVVLTLAA